MLYSIIFKAVNSYYLLAVYSGAYPKSIFICNTFIDYIDLLSQSSYIISDNSFHFLHCPRIIIVAKSLIA